MPICVADFLAEQKPPGKDGFCFSHMNQRIRKQLLLLRELQQ
jgi:hypothetical protein